MARAQKATIRRFAIFSVHYVDGNPQRPKYRRRAYNIVEYNWGDNAGVKTYRELCFGRPKSTAEDWEEYDDVRIYKEDDLPKWDLEGQK